MFYYLQAFSQQIKVPLLDGDPIPGVNIINTNWRWNINRFDGNFNRKISDGDVIEFSYIDFHYSTYSTMVKLT